MEEAAWAKEQSVQAQRMFHSDALFIGFRLLCSLLT